jgi:cell division septation protein DedD
MKSCPTCNRTYADETLTYCLDDGSLLSAPYDPEATQRIPPPRITNAQTEALPPPHSEVARPNRNPLPTYIIIALLALIAGGGIVALLRLGVKDTSTANPPVSNSSNVSNISSTSPASIPKPGSETEANTTPTASMSTSPPIRQLPQPSTGTWFVILGSFSKNDYEQANQRLQSVRGLGYDASIIDTTNYPGLRGGLWAVVMGPYSQSSAKSLVVQMKSVRSDAYIKSGW